VGLGIDLLLAGGLAWAWRGGLLFDERRLLQVALLPLVAVLAAPYALVHELSCWPVTLCLLERYTRQRPLPRALVLLLGTCIWLTADLAVVDPNPSRGADLAALLGLGLAVCLVAVLSTRRDRALMPDQPVAQAGLPTISACPSTSSVTSSS
jgi:hypothetical protein